MSPMHLTQMKGQKMGWSVAKNKSKWMILGAIVGALVAGGAWANVDNYGAIAMNKYTGRTGYSYNYHSIEAAKSEAILQCGSNCRSMLWFKNGCGAIAFGHHGRYGAGIAGSRRAAEARAVSECGLSSCRPKVWACTDR